MPVQHQNLQEVYIAAGCTGVVAHMGIMHDI